MITTMHTSPRLQSDALTPAERIQRARAATEQLRRTMIVEAAQVLADVHELGLETVVAIITEWEHNRPRTMPAALS